MMVRARRDNLTGDLLSWEPPQVAVGYAPDVTGRGSLESKISRLVGRALRDARDEGKSGRRDVAQAMTAYLQRPISEAMLNKWSAEASDEHRIPLDAFIALVHATGAEELLGFMPELFGFVVVPARYADIIELQLIDEHEKDIAARRAALTARVRAKR